jgi:TRAP transporter TAXI family solute receptor
MRRLRGLTLCFALASSLAASGVHAQQSGLTWSAGQPTGGWYLQAAALSKLVKSKDANLDIKPVAGAAYGNMSKLQKGETTLAWSLPPVITAAYSGAEPYTAPQSDVRVVMTGLGLVDSQFCVAANSPIHSIRQIFQKKMAIKIGSPRPGGSDEWELRKIFAFYKTTYSDLQHHGGNVVFGSFSELADQYGKGTIDAFILNNALPAGDVEKASAARKMRILPMDDDLLAYLGKFGLVRTVIPKGSYKNVINNKTGIKTAAMANTIVTSAKVPDAVIYNFTKVLLSNLKDVRAIDPTFGDFNPKQASKLADVPLHPGAAKAFREAHLLQ